MDEFGAIKDKVRFIFNGYKSTNPAMQVYKIEEDLIFGFPDEIGYKIMDFVPDSFVQWAERSPEYFQLMMVQLLTEI